MEHSSGIEYTGLDWANRETRFLQFLEDANSRSGVTNLQLSKCPLGHAPPFWALSYCWGSGNDFDAINVNGKQVMVRKNLADALKHCDLQAGDRIWVDAICINQKDVSERNYQLGFIGHIYWKAAQTLVWLGSEGAYTELAYLYLRACEDVASAVNNDWIAQGGRQKANRGARSVFSDDYEFRPGTYERCLANRNFIFQEAMKRVDRVDKAHQGLRELLLRSYWERVWIIQEVAKSRHVSVKCGVHYFDLEMLFLASSILSEMTHRSRWLLDAIRRFRVQQQRVSSSWTRCSLLRALIYTRFSQSTDPRDKVYALLGLTTDGQDLVPNPSYADTEAEVFYSLSSNILSSRRPNNALLIARHDFPRRRKAFPPWVLRPGALPDLPPWLVDIQSDDADQSWTFDARGSTLHARGVLLASTGGVQTAPISGAPRSSRTDDNEPVATPNKHRRYLACLLRRFYVGNRERPDLLSDVSLTDAFARMIRDADKGESAYSAQYELDHTQSTLRDIGAISIQHKNLARWAYNHNVQRQSQITTDQMKLEQRPYMPQRDSQLLSVRIDTGDFRIIEHVLSDLLCQGGCRLKLEVTDENHPVVLSAETRPRYQIWQVDQCQLPLVLEFQSWSGQYVVLGEACFGRNTDGTWWSARRALRELRRNTHDAQMLTIQLDPESTWHSTASSSRY